MIFPSHYRFYTNSLITGHSYIYFLLNFIKSPYFSLSPYFSSLSVSSEVIPLHHLLHHFRKNHNIDAPRQKARPHRNLVRLYGLWRYRTKSAASPPYQLHLPQFVHGIQLFFLIFASQGRISTEDASELRIVHCWFRTWKQISSLSILICTGSIWIFSGCMQLW